MQNKHWNTETKQYMTVQYVQQATIHKYILYSHIEMSARLFANNFPRPVVTSFFVEQSENVISINKHVNFAKSQTRTDTRHLVINHKS